LAQYDIQEFDDFLVNPSFCVLHLSDLIAQNREYLLQYAQAVATWRTHER
jgi:hypothetical protein